MARRDNGEGYLYTEGDKFCWRLKVDGVVVAVVKRNTAALRRAEIKRKLIELEAAKGLKPSADTKSQTVSQYLDWWLLYIVKGGRSDQTYRQYEQACRLHIKPLIGNHRLKKLSSQNVVDMMAALSDPARMNLIPGNKKPNLSPRTRNIALVVLKTALNSAMAEQPPRLTNNAAMPVKPAKGEPNVKQHLTTVGTSTLMTATTDSRYDDMASLMLFTGVRVSEAIGWTWDDYAAEGDTRSLRVNKTLQWSPRPTNKEGDYTGHATWKLADVKKPKSRRLIALGTRAREAVERIKAEQDRNRSKMGKLWPDTNLIFTTECGTPVKPRNLQRALNQILKSNKLGHISLHGLRRAYGNTLARAFIYLAHKIGCTWYNT